MWHITIILDELNPAIIREMPCWALETPQRRQTANEIWTTSREEFWTPEPALTLFRSGGAKSEAELLNNIIDTVLEHHPRATCLELVGVAKSPELSGILLERNYVPMGEWEDGLRFQIPFDQILNVPILKMDASTWISCDDVFDSFFAVVGAPPSHGRNLNALEDTIVSGWMNRVGLPYILAIENLDRATGDGRVQAQEFIGFIKQLEFKGCPVTVKSL